MLGKKNKKTSQQEVKQIKQPENRYMQMAQDFERDRIAETNKSKKIAWIVASSSLVIAAASVLAIMLLVPLKTVEPFVIRVDNNTGATDIVYALKNGKQNYGEVLDKYWLSRYVINRENYDWETIQASFDTVKLMSTPRSFNDYSAKFKDKDSILKTYANYKKIMVKVNSISFFDNIAQVRFETTTLPTSGIPMNGEGIPRRWIATIAYEYQNSPSNEAERLVNPLGFKVLSYRVDPENVGAN